MTIKMITALVAATGLLFLTACGGGGGGGGDTSRGPSTAPTLTVGSVQTADPNATQNSAGQVANNLPAFGSVTQSSNGGSVSGITSDAASTSFDGRNLGVTVRRADGTSIKLNTAAHSIEAITFDSAIPGHDRGRGDAMLHVTDNTASIAGAYVSWDNSDPTDYLAGGFWMHVEGNVLAGTISGAEIGAFVDGPELNGPTNLPVSGSAIYQGPTEGLYVQRWGTDFPSVAPGSTEIGGYEATIDLTADFGTNMISGCVGCTGTIDSIGLFEDGRTGQVYKVTDSSEGRLTLGPAAIGPDGSFRNRRVSIFFPGLTFTSNSGSWGGKLSNIPSAEGDPRLVAGTYGGEAETAGQSSVVFVGAYYANKR